jgi:predicted amidohydrolase YtcJ
LHDHHIHLHALAAARASVVVGPPDVRSATALAAALRRTAVSKPGRWIRAVGYHESVAGDLTADVLDRLVPEASGTPIRVQHRTGQLWSLNRRAVDLAEVATWRHDGVERDAMGRVTGRLFGLDAELRCRLPAMDLDMVSLGVELAAYGVTGVTDMTPSTATAAVERLQHETLGQAFPVRVTISGGPDLASDAAPGLDRGPVKLLPPDHADPDVDAIARGIASAHESGRPVAIHCVTRVGLVAALEAWRRVGARSGDRIEHGAVIPGELIDVIRGLGLIVVTQPNFIAERGDEYLADVDAHDLAHLWRCRTLAARGISVAGGTDAPFGHPDPWRAIAAAIDRSTPAGVRIGADDRLVGVEALSLYLGAPDRPGVPREVKRGQRTDLCLLDRSLQHVLAEPSSRFVRATVGRLGLRCTEPA